jgi:prevent-host-death family protein
MSTYSIAQAKDQLSRLVDEALAGKQVTITRHGKPVAELRPAGHAHGRQPRPTFNGCASDARRYRRSAVMQYR